MFDLTVNLGNLLTIISFLVGGVTFVYAIRSDVKTIQARLMLVEEELDQLTGVLVSLARQDERLNYLNKELQDLKKK
jgi:K+/H+ antiporter YhaU regulatory subunit KhtT